MAPNKQILLVDDDVDFVTINKMALEAAGYTVITAHDGKTGLKLATEKKVDAAVLDVIMSAPDEGFELARNLRKDARTKTIPLVMLSSINAVSESKGFMFRISDRDRDEMWLPIDKFLDKPVKPDQLVKVISEITG